MASELQVLFSFLKKLIISIYFNVTSGLAMGRKLTLLSWLITLAVRPTRECISVDPPGFLSGFQSFHDNIRLEQPFNLDMEGRGEQWRHIFVHSSCTGPRGWCWDSTALHVGCWPLVCLQRQRLPLPPVLFNVDMKLLGEVVIRRFELWYHQYSVGMLYNPRI